MDLEKKSEESRKHKKFLGMHIVHIVKRAK